MPTTVRTALEAKNFLIGKNSKFIGRVEIDKIDNDDVLLISDSSEKELADVSKILGASGHCASNNTIVVLNFGKYN